MHTLTCQNPECARQFFSEKRTRKFCCLSCAGKVTAKLLHGTETGMRVSEEKVAAVYSEIDRLEEAGKPIKIDSIALRLSIDRRTVARAVAALEIRGLVRRIWICTTKRYQRVEA